MNDIFNRREMDLKVINVIEGYELEAVPDDELITLWTCGEISADILALLEVTGEASDFGF